jgi:hypothetical protein
MLKIEKSKRGFMCHYVLIFNALSVSGKKEEWNLDLGMWLLIARVHPSFYKSIDYFSTLYCIALFSLRAISYFSAYLLLQFKKFPPFLVFSGDECFLSLWPHTKLSNSCLFIKTGARYYLSNISIETYKLVNHFIIGELLTEGIPFHYNILETLAG